MYTEPKLVDLVDTCFSCDGTPHIACHECKVLHCTLHASDLCQSEIYVGLCQFWAPTLLLLLGICMARFALHCGLLVHIPNRAVFNSPCSSVQNGHFSVDHYHFGGVEEAHIPLAMDPHPAMGVNSRSSTNSRSNKADLIFKCVFRKYL